MKNLARCLCVLSLFTICNNTYSQDWIPYVNNSSAQTVQTCITQQTYVSPTILQPLLVYQSIPYIIHQPVIVEQRCLLYRTQKIIYVPQVFYYYNPLVIYR
jgi:hypothetical protein